MAGDSRNSANGSGDVVAADHDTVEYFDQEAPAYATRRLRRVVEFLNTPGVPTGSLVDLGCGVGNTLRYLADNTPVQSFVAVDVSRTCLDRTREVIHCETHLGSALDPVFIRSLEGRFDGVVLSAVLHHLVGSTRRVSRAQAVAGIRHGLQLTTPHGHLLINEPTFAPRPLLWAVFWAKRAVVKVARNRRIPVFGHWSNIGAPVVSYYGVDELTSMIHQAGGELVRSWDDHHRLPIPLRWMFRRSNLTVAVRRRS